MTAARARPRPTLPLVLGMLAVTACSSTETPPEATAEELDRAIQLAVQEARQEWSRQTLSSIRLMPVSPGGQIVGVKNGSPYTVVGAETERRFVVAGREVGKRTPATFKDATGVPPHGWGSWHVYDFEQTDFPPNTTMQFHVLAVDVYDGATALRIEPWGWEKQAELDLLLERLSPEQHSEIAARLEQEQERAIAASRERELVAIEEEVSISEAAKRADAIELAVLQERADKARSALEILRSRQEDRLRLEAEARDAELRRQEARTAERQRRQRELEAAQLATLRRWASAYVQAERSLVAAESKLDAETNGGQAMVLGSEAAKQAVAVSMRRFVDVPASGFQTVDQPLGEAQVSYRSAIRWLEEGDSKLYIEWRSRGRSARARVLAVLRSFGAAH